MMIHSVTLSNVKRRPSGISKLDRSSVNRFSPVSTPSSELGTNTHREVTEEHERKVVLEIVDKIFDEKTGIISISSSGCTTPQNASKEQVYDKRLQYWKDMLEERKRIAAQIQATTGKPSSGVLFNQRSTYQERDKRMVQRVLDYGSRLNPLTMVHKRLLRVHEMDDLNTCLNYTEVYETLPMPERKGEGIIEVSGMPIVTKQEQLGEDSCKPSKWLDSEVLRTRVEEKREDLERVIEFYPDIENLQIVGESILKGAVVKHNSSIELLNEEIIKEISSETVVNVEDCKHEQKDVKSEEPIIYGLKINEHTYIVNAKRSTQHVEMEARFECHPFEHVVKRVMHFENIGQKVVNIELVPRNYYTKVPTLLRATDNEFLFDCTPFRLTSGEKRDIIVLYQPRKVDVVKQQWLLKIEPQFFCRKNDSIMLKLSGRCKPPVEYAEKLSGTLRNVVDKSNIKMMRKLETNLGGLVPLIKPDEVTCPYRRALDERELFELLNPGYVCERFHDLELLKDIHKRLKKPREPVWDLRITSLDQFIMRLKGPEDRALVFNEMLGILEHMKGKPIELEIKVEENPERQRARFLYVRGLVSTCIDEWEDLAITIEEVFVSQAVKVYHAKKAKKEKKDVEKVKEEKKAKKGKKDAEKEEEEKKAKEEKKDAEKEEEEKKDGDDEERKESDILEDIRTLQASVIYNVDENELREIMAKKVLRQKPYRDTLYMQTYTLLCNFIEDVVSVIESTEIV